MNKTVSLNTTKIIRTLLTVTIVLGVIHLVLQFLQSKYDVELFGLVKLFDLDNEVSIPTWFSQTLWLTAALCAALVIDGHKKWWRLLALLCVYFSLDEGATLHEHGIMVLSRIIPRAESGLSSAWLVFAGISMAVVLLIVGRSFLALPKITKIRIFIAALIFISGAVVVEIFGIQFLRVTEHTDTFLHLGVFVAIEEGAEMLGVIFLIWSILSHQINFGKNKLNIVLTES